MRECDKEGGRNVRHAGDEVKTGAISGSEGGREGGGREGGGREGRKRGREKQNPLNDTHT